MKIALFSDIHANLPDWKHSSEMLAKEIPTASTA